MSVRVSVEVRERLHREAARTGELPAGATITTSGG